MNIKNWIPENQIDILAENAASSYEMNNNWEEASRITYEYASDELRIKPSLAAMRLVIQRAKTIWTGETMRVKAIITNAGSIPTKVMEWTASSLRGQMRHSGDLAITH